MSELSINEDEPKEPTGSDDDSEINLELLKSYAFHEDSGKSITVFINRVDTYHGKHILSFLNRKGEEINKANKVNKSNESVTIDQILSKEVQKNSTSRYIFIGTASDSKYQKPDYVSRIIDERHENFQEIINGCNCVIYDISIDKNEIPKALSTLSIIEQEIERLRGTYFKEEPGNRFIKFILISSAMTWGQTPLLDPDEPDIPFIGIDYKKRKPHPNFREHYACEKEVIQKGRRFKGNLQTCVLCCGITYGLEESTLLFLFMRAWNMDKRLPIFGSGLNYVPLVHVLDLANVIYHLCHIYRHQNQPYILVVEQTPAILKLIVKGISRCLGSGRTQNIDSEEAFLYPRVDQTLYDYLTTNILMEPEFIVKTLRIEWQSELNFVENMDSIAEEFRESRQLKPLKIFLYGPPGSGKKRLARKLRARYGTQVISPESIVEETVDEIKEAFLRPPDSDPEGVSDEDFRASLEEKRQLLGTSWEDPTAKLTEDQIVQLIRSMMRGNACRNQGYVLIGFPKRIIQAKHLFEGSSDHRVMTLSEELMPKYVVHLKASNDFLIDRMSRLSEKYIQENMYTEKEYIQKLMHFRESESDDLIEYFQNFKEIQTLKFSLNEFPSEEMDEIFYMLTKIIGPPIGFGLNVDEQNELETIHHQRHRLESRKKSLDDEISRRNAEEKNKLELEEEIKKINKQRQIDDRLLLFRVNNFRSYLAEQLPLIARGLIAAAEQEPPDPVDFLAKYLFANNPNGMMYNPQCDRKGEVKK